MKTTTTAVIKKLGHILKGWSKSLGLVSITDAEQKLSALRLEKCNACQWAKSSSALEWINGDVETVMSLHCMRCKCPCRQKSLVVDEKCPENKW